MAGNEVDISPQGLLEQGQHRPFGMPLAQRSKRLGEISGKLKHQTCFSLGFEEAQIRKENTETCQEGGIRSRGQVKRQVPEFVLG